MKKWNNPEIAELNIGETAAVAETCKDGISPCYAPGNGGGQCRNCKGNNPTGNKDYRIPPEPSNESEKKYDDIDGLS